MRFDKLRYLPLVLLSHPMAALAAEHVAEHAAEHGAGHGGHAPAGIESLIWPAVNFFIYAAMMHHFYKKYARPALLARSANFEQHVQRAAKVLEDADRELHKLEARVQGIAEEQRQIRERLATEGAQIAAQVMTQAEQTANSNRRDVGRRIERELNAATNEVKQLVIAKATEIARAQLRSGLSTEDDFRLRQDAIRSLL